MDFIKDIYSTLIFDKNWSMCDVDNMDIFYYLEVLSYKIESNKDKEENNEKDVYIDEVSWL